MRITCSECTWTGHTAHLREEPVYQNVTTIGSTFARRLLTGYRSHCPKCDSTSLRPAASPAAATISIRASASMSEAAGRASL